MPDPYAFAPSLAWLAACTAYGLARTPIPTWLFAASWPLAAAASAWLSGPWPAASGAAGSVVVFAALAWSGIASRGTTAAVTVALAGLPALDWWALLPGAAGAAAWAAWQVRRATGPGYLTMLAGETLAAVGTLPGSGDPARMPVPDQSGSGMVARASAIRVRLAGWLLAGLAGVAAVAALMTLVASASRP